jgi:CRP-like cAMP-binding protein
MPKEHYRLHPAFKQAHIFKGLQPDHLEVVASHFHMRTLLDDEILFHQDDPATIFYLILDGQIKILQSTAEGFEVILHVLGPGDIVGALPTIGEGTYPAGATSLGTTQVAFVDAETFDYILREHPIITKNLLVFATKVLQRSHLKIRELATERVERRIARALSRLSGQLGRKQGGQIHLDFPLSQQDLAEMTGTTVYTVSRTLNEWKRQGILDHGRERIIILEPHELIKVGEDLLD